MLLNLVASVASSLGLMGWEQIQLEVRAVAARGMYVVSFTDLKIKK